MTRPLTKDQDKKIKSFYRGVIEDIKADEYGLWVRRVPPEERNIPVDGLDFFREREAFIKTVYPLPTKPTLIQRIASYFIKRFKKKPPNINRS